jgi:phosphatidylglycerophosphatase A
MIKNKMGTLLATFFGIGKVAPLPGTVTTALCIPLVWLLSLSGHLAYSIACIILFLVSVWAAEVHEQIVKVHDLNEIVIDEVIGFFVAMAFLPITWKSLLAGFFIFRLLDIFKPYPISWFDKNVKGGFGVVIDDVVAGVATNLILLLFIELNFFL